MDRFIENKIDIKNNKSNGEINEFIKKLQNALEKSEILNNKNLYNEI